MSESVIRGIIMGAFLGAVATVVYVIRRLMAAKSEGARRIKLVLGGCIVLFVGAFLLAEAGVAGTLITAAVIGTIVWVRKGFNK